MAALKVSPFLPTVLTQILDYSCNFPIYKCFFPIKRKCCQPFLRFEFLSLCRYVVL